MLQTYILPIAKRVQETPDTVSFYFKQAKIDRIPYYAGQYVTVKVEIEGEPHFRSYSMSSSPQLDDHLVITVKQLRGGLVSTYLHEKWQEGELVEFLRPAGRFIAEFATKHQRHIIAVAGGSGITPIYSILRGILFQEPKSRVSVLYANRSQKEVIFLSQLQDLAHKFPERFQLSFVLSRPDKTDHIPYATGRITAESFADWYHQLAHQDDQKEEFFICGPDGLMKSVSSALSGLDISASAIHLEQFQADSQMQDRQSKSLQPKRKVVLRIGEELHELWVPSGATILEAGLSQGLELPYSCKRGICATCMGKLLEGEILMDDPSALLDFELEAGKVLICQASPSSENVHIQVGL